MLAKPGERSGIEEVMHEFQLANEVILCNWLGRAYVVVSDEAMALAERLALKASERSGWPIRVMTRNQLDAKIAEGATRLRQLDGVDASLADLLVGEGVLSLNDLAGVAPAELAEFAQLTLEQAEKLVKQAKDKSSGE